MADVLERILAAKVEEIAKAKGMVGATLMRRRAEESEGPRDFTGALRRKVAAGAPAVIAEIKKASPSKGLLREPFDPAAIARSYAQHGAACLSVLTDQRFFQGSAEDLAAARSACDLPVLRKDFIVDPYQIYESRVLGADCVLLIVAALDLPTMLELEAVAGSLGMAVLVEVHNRTELDLALRLATPLIGINNRDLRTFKTSLAVSEQLAPKIPREWVVVAESGLNAPADLARLKQIGISAFLIGESLMRQSDVAAATRALLARQPRRAAAE